MTTTKIDPGEGWRLLAVGEVIQEGDEIFHRYGDDEKWGISYLAGERVTNAVFRRRVQPAPADGWLDLASVKPLPPMWVSRPGERVCFVDDMLVNPKECGWTHWQPANVPEPPAAKEPELTPEDKLCEKWIIEHGVTGLRGEQREAWDAALAWRKVNP